MEYNYTLANAKGSKVFLIDGTEIDENEAIAEYKENPFLIGDEYTYNTVRRYSTDNASTSNASTSTFNNIPPSPTSIDSNSSDVAFFIPYDKLPNSLLAKLSVNDSTISNSDVNALVRIVAQELYHANPHPTRSLYRLIAQELCDRYPCLFDRDEDTKALIGSGYYNVFKKIEERIHYLRRPNHPAGTSKISKTKIKHLSAGCREWEPTMPIEETPESLHEKQLWLATNSAIKERDEQKVEHFLEVTYSYARQFLNTTPTISAVIAEWPILMEPKYMLKHFERLCCINTSECMSTFLAKITKTIDGIKHIIVNKTDIASAALDNDNDLLKCLKLAGIYFKEDIAVLFQNCQEVTKSDVSELSKTPSPSILSINTGDTDKVYYLVVEKQIISEVSSSNDALKIICAAYYVFNLAYPQEAQCILEFIQRYIFKINPTEGSKVKKTTKQLKVNDASGQYSTNMLFGNEYWLGSLEACKDLQLTKYYRQVPPYPTTFYMARVNLTMDVHHLPMSRVMAIGECVPASCSADHISWLLSQSGGRAVHRATAAGLVAGVQVVNVRPVPGPYSFFGDFKFHIMASVSLLTFMLMLVASVYEGYLERRYRLSRGTLSDLELSHSKPSLNNNEPQGGGKPTKEDSREKDLRRETCGTWAELLLSFSVLSNGRTILSTQRPSDGALTCLHGMRFLSVAWVIMVHTYLAVFYIADNKTMRTVIERNFMYQSVGNASYCVDTFFFISGLLVTVLFLRTEDKKATHKINKEKKLQQNGFTNSALSVSVISQNSFSQDFLEKPKEHFYSIEELMKVIKSFFVMFFYRVLRLTPAYGFVIGLTEILIRYAVNQSVFEPAIFDHITCDLYWWRNLLYINNLYPQREMCMVWSWYMANDTQFYVVGIILLLMSVKYPRFSMASLGIVMVTSWATTMYISVWYQYKARIQEPFEMFDPLYDKPWSRIGPYLVGMMVGWYLHKTKCQVKMPYWLVILGWPSAIAIMGSLIFGMVDGYFEVWPTAFYVSIGHTGWGVALAWVAIACCCGYGGLVNSLLSYRGLLPLSRLAYCAYLVHPALMMYTTFLMDGPLHLQNTMVLIIYAGYAVVAFIASFIISMAFEAPVVRLLKIINSGGTRKDQNH